MSKFPLRTLTIFLLSLTIAAATSNFTVGEKETGVTRIDFNLGTYTTETIDGDLRLLVPNAGTTTEPGMPEIPVLTTMFQMEAGIAYEAVYEVRQSSIIENVTVFPFQDINSEQATQKNSEFYNSSDVYPAENLTLSEPVVMRGLEMITVSIAPYRYHADTQELEVLEEIEIFVYESGTRPLSLANTMPRSLTFERLYESMVVNYERSDRDEDYQTPAILYICGGGSNGAISHPAFLELVNWRHKRGYIVYTAHTGETGSSNNQIKTYIQNAYEDFDPPPEFVGLVGDDGGAYDIPAWSMNSGDSDHPYTQLDGGDLLPEVLVGRISVTSSTQLMTVIAKTLNYEQAVDTSDNWLEKAALVGDPSSSGLSAVITNEYIENIITNWGMDDARTRFSSGFSSWMQNQLDEGIGYFNYRGYIGTSGFSASNINNANNGHKTPFVTFITCSTGNFASGWGDAITESFIRAGTPTSPKGGVAAIGTATSSTHTAPNNIVDMGIYDGLFAKGMETGAEGLFNGKLSLYNTYPSNPNNLTSKFTGWNNLMGDPAIHVWTDTPLDMTADFPAEIGVGSNYIQVIVTDENDDPVGDARVTVVTDNDDIFLTALTDEWGVAIVDLDPTYVGDVDLTITKRNHIPIVEEFEIIDDGPVVNIDEGITVDDSGDNNDGFLNPGETVLVSIPLTNYGSEDAVNVMASLSGDDNLVTVLSGDVSYGTIAPGVTLIADFEISIGSDVINMADLNLVLDANDVLANDWSSLIQLPVYGGHLNIDDYDVTSGYLVHGGTADVAIRLSNLGMVGLTDVTAEIIYVPNLLEITNPLLSWGDLDVGEDGYSITSFTVEVSNDIISGTVFPIEVHLQSAEGYSRVEYLQLQVGTVGVQDPMGPDSHGYYIYDSGDMSYSLALPYDWMEINPSQGGPGTSLNMNDSGEGNPQSQQSAHVDLPFTFTFYGVDYDEITVSTNGWIAFGDSELESFRNYQIPGAGGPSPMLAVFWDDLKTSNGGNVYKYVNSDEGYVVIEWYNMYTAQTYNNPNTFQAILYDSVTPTGDDEILLQYHTFNNTSVGDYNSYTPHHGCHATIGIENHLGNMGLQYTFDDEYPEAAMELDDETALFITTQQPIALTMGDVNQDGEINIQDIIMVVNHTLNLEPLGPLPRYIGDMNQDGHLNILDVIMIINAILNS